LLSVFWLDLPRPAAQQTLRTTLYELRKVFGSNLIIDADQVGLAQDVWVDARHFVAKMDSSEAPPDQTREILELYRGDFLEGVGLVETQSFEDWLTIERERYRRLAVRGLSALASAYERRADFVTALECLGRALAFNPLQEDLQRESIRLLYLSGDRPGAIRRYDELRRLLDDEMGVPPMIEARIVRCDRRTGCQRLGRARLRHPAPPHPAVTVGSGRPENCLSQGAVQSYRLCKPHSAPVAWWWWKARPGLARRGLSMNTCAHSLRFPWSGEVVNWSNLCLTMRSSKRCVAWRGAQNGQPCFQSWPLICSRSGWPK
jgi:DNA-binding SARP family transcriptional activator